MDAQSEVENQVIAGCLSATTITLT